MTKIDFKMYFHRNITFKNFDFEQKVKFLFFEKSFKPTRQIFNHLQTSVRPSTWCLSSILGSKYLSWVSKNIFQVMQVKYWKITFIMLFGQLHCIRLSQSCKFHFINTLTHKISPLYLQNYQKVNSDARVFNMISVK